MRCIAGARHDGIGKLVAHLTRRRPLACRTQQPMLGQWRERTYPAESTTDWVGSRNSVNPRTEALQPYHGEEILCTTPLLMWPDLGASHTYTVQVQDELGNLLRTVTTEPGNNFIILPKAQALPAGAVYRWIVRSATNPTTYPYSSPRNFYVRPEANAYEVDIPGASTTLGQRLYDKALGLNGQTAIAHPRMFTKDTTTQANMASSFIPGDQRYALVAYIDANMSTWEAQALPTETIIAANPNSTLPYNFRLIFSLIYYWKLGGSSPAMALRARNQAKARGVALCTYWNGTTGVKRGYGTAASTDQTGSRTDYVTQDQDCRVHVMILGMLYDTFSIGSGSLSDMTSAEQTRCLEYLDYRAGGPDQMVSDLYGNRALNVFQYESHGIGNIGYLAYALLMVAESDMSAFPTTYGMATYIPDVVKQLLPLWLTMVQAFRNDDGSAHSGLAYDDLDSVSNPIVTITTQMFGINLMDKPKYFNGPMWRLYMNGVPGARDRSQFGDSSAENAPYRGCYAALADRYPSVTNSYLYDGLDATDMLNYGNPFTPKRGVRPAPVAPLLLSAIFPTGGYYGSLANFTDPNCTAVYMRSSVHGGFNHAHHDANGIIVWFKGKQLIIDSGYYNIVNYGPPHFVNWQRHSRGHNTLSLDFGAGNQKSSVGDSDIDRLSNAKMIAWGETGDYSYALGDATRSYTETGYELSSYLRAVLHFRDNVVITIDYALSASGAHTYDWNFHTYNAVTYSAGVYTITDGAATGYVKNEYCNLALATPAAYGGTGVRTGAAYNYTGWDGQLGLTGAVSSGTTTSLTLTGATWTTNQYAGAWLTVNGLDRQITSNTATTLNWSSPLPGAAAGAFKIADLWAPGPPASFPPSTNQYHHRISTSGTGTEYKAVTSVSLGTNGQITGQSTAAVGNTIAFTFTLNGRTRTVTLDFVLKTVTVS